MNTRQTKKAFRKMAESNKGWYTYSHKKFAKCFLRNRQRKIDELNKIYKGTGVVFTKYIMPPAPPILVGNYIPSQLVNTRYAIVKPTKKNYYGLI